MISLSAKLRAEGKQALAQSRKSNRIPGVVYGHNVKNALLDIDYVDFQRVYREAGETSLIELKVEGEKEVRPVLVHDIQMDPLTDKVVHLDFFQASLKEEVQVAVPLVFQGESLAVKDLGGTLVKTISELEVKALPQNLPHEIIVSIDKLNTLDDQILVKDLVLPQNVKAVPDPEEIIASVAGPANVEAELEVPIEEKVEEVEKVEKEKKEDEVVEDTPE